MAAIGWESLVQQKCYSSNFDYLRKQGVAAEDEYLGRLVSAPVKTTVEDASNPDYQYGGGRYSVWSADFSKDGAVTKRYQTKDPAGNKMLGFYF